MLNDSCDTGILNLFLAVTGILAMFHKKIDVCYRFLVYTLSSEENSSYIFCISVEINMRSGWIKVEWTRDMVLRYTEQPMRKTTWWVKAPSSRPQRDSPSDLSFPGYSYWSLCSSFFIARLVSSFFRHLLNFGTTFLGNLGGPIPLSSIKPGGKGFCWQSS